MYYPWKNIIKSYRNNKFKISAPTWKEKFDPFTIFAKTSILDV